MENLQIILSLAGAAFGLLVTVLTFLVKSVKNAKAKKIAEQTLKISNAVLPYIQEAEKFTAYSGEEKKAYVMTKANQYAIQSGMLFDALQVSEKIEELVALTRQVNVKMKAQQTEEAAAENRPIAATQKSWL